MDEMCQSIGKFGNSSLGLWGCPGAGCYAVADLGIGNGRVEWRCHDTEVHMQITLPLSVSDWEYKSASGGGLTVMFAAASGGLLTLTDPNKAEQQFRYGSLGVGVGAGARFAAGRQDQPAGAWQKRRRGGHQRRPPGDR